MLIILYVMDSLRADILSCYGNSKETSPCIDSLAREGVLFEKVFSQSTYTKASGASLLSSLYPSVHGARVHGDLVRDHIPLLQEELRKIGFRTIAISSIANISRFFGFGRGFDVFIELYKRDVLTHDHRSLSIKMRPIPTSEDINRFLIPFLTENKNNNAFIMAWSVDTHNPYFHRDRRFARFHEPNGVTYSALDIVRMNSPEEVRSLKALYEDMVFYNDLHIGRLLDALKEMGLYEETLFVLTSDHGEAFGEHGFNGHGGPPFEEQIRIPLVIKFPFSSFCGRFDNLVRQIDIAPTILEFANGKGHNLIGQGKSLLPTILERKGENIDKNIDNFAFVDSQLHRRLPRYFAIRTEDYKFIKAERGKFTLKNLVKRDSWPLLWLISKPKMLFDIKTDPLETNNIWKIRGKPAKDLEALLNCIIRNNETLEEKGEEGNERKREADEEIVKQLKMLGYLDD